MVTGAFPDGHLTEQSPRPMPDKDEKAPRSSQDSFVDVEIGTNHTYTPVKQPSRLKSFTRRPYVRLIMILMAIALVVGTTVVLIMSRPYTPPQTPDLDLSRRGLIAAPYQPINGQPPVNDVHTLPVPTPTFDHTLTVHEAAEEFAHRPQVAGMRRHAADNLSVEDSMATAVPVRRHNVTAPFTSTTAPHANLTKPLASEDLDVDTLGNSNGGPVGSSAGLVGGIIGGIVAFIVVAVLLCMCCGGGRH